MRKESKHNTKERQQTTRKTISMEKKTGVAILISNTIGFKTKTAIKGQRRALHDDYGVNQAKRYKVYKYICTQCRSTKIYKANINTLKGGNRQQYNNGRGL